MVNVLSDAEQRALTQAITEAEERTGAELVVTLAPASDPYQSYLLLDGLLAGSAAAMALWAAKLVVDFPFLFFIQVAFMTLFTTVPWLRHVCLRLVPRRVRHHRAAHRAYEEYLAAARHVSAGAQVVLLYVSVAERYAHILTSRSIREKIPDEQWQAVIATLTSSIPSHGLPQACVKAVGHIAELLAPHFPRVPPVKSE